MAKVTVVDYGMGNLRSMVKALEYVGAERVRVSGDPEDLKDAERVVLPGVGAFGEAMSNLRAQGLVEALSSHVHDRGIPFLGVCLGMQVLASTGVEHGDHQGLGWIKGTCTRLSTEGSKRVPHTAWDVLEVAETDSPLRDVRPDEAFYFNHSYHLAPDSESVIDAWGKHETRFVAAVKSENVMATQFHPEKSQMSGLNVLAGFLDWNP